MVEFIVAGIALIIQCPIPFHLAKTPGFSFGKLQTVAFCLLHGPRADWFRCRHLTLALPIRILSKIFLSKKNGQIVFSSQNFQVGDI